MTNRVFLLNIDCSEVIKFLPAENETVLKNYLNNTKTEKQHYNLYELNLPIKLEKKKVPFRYIDNLLKNILPKYDEVRFENLPEDIQPDFFAYGNKSILVKGTFIENNSCNDILEELDLQIGHLTERASKKIKELSKAIYEICFNYELIIFDIKEQKIIENSSSHKIRNYFDKIYIMKKA